MKKIFMSTVFTCMMVITAQLGYGATLDEAEGCQVLNPVQSDCSYNATHKGESPVTGVAGWGKWVVKIKVGKKTTVERSPSNGEPTTIEMFIPKGAKVTMKALTPGSGGTVGHVD